MSEKLYVDVECTLKPSGKPCGFKTRLYAKDKAGGLELMRHLEESHRVHLVNVQPLSFFVIRDTNDPTIKNQVIKP